MTTSTESYLFNRAPCAGVVPSSDASIAAFRVVLGLRVATLHGWHEVGQGWQYLSTGAGWPLLHDTVEIGFPIPVVFATLAALGQFFGGWLLALGAGSRFAALVVAAPMWTAMMFNLQTGGPDAQRAGLYALAASAFVVAGGRRWAVDRYLYRGALAALLLLTGATVDAQDTADLIIYNASITTQVSSGQQPSAVAVKGETILAVGSDQEMLTLRAPGTTVVDANRRRLIPGLNDSHLHPTREARYYSAELRWDGVPTLEQALEMVRHTAARTPEGQWVRVVGGWSPYQFAEKRMPSPEELTLAAPNTPVFVLHLYSGGIYNRKGVDVARLNDATAPDGGTIEKGADGQATGRIFATPRPTILYRAVGQLGELPRDAQASSARHFYRELNRFGLTSAIDAGGGGHAYPSQYAATVDMASSERLPLRISYYLFAQKPGQELTDIESWVERERLGENLDAHHDDGLVLEGAGETLVWSAGDFENFQAARPDLDANPKWREELTVAVRTLVQRRWPMRIHATYDQTIDRILSVIESVDREEKAAGRAGLTDLRWALDHVETIQTPQTARIKALGGGVMIQNRMAFAGEDFITRYGVEAAGQAPPVQQLLAAGIPVGLGTDGTRVSSYNPWLSLYWLVSGKGVGGTPLLSDVNRLDRAKALELYTVGSAWFSGEEGVKGRIAPGQYADLALLSADYFAVPEEQIRRIESVLTVTGGTLVYAAGPYKYLVPELEPILPAWSPVRRFGGYYNALEK